MALVNIKEMLEKARKEHYAVGAFDASTIEMAMAIVEAAEEEKSPVIVMGLQTYSRAMKKCLPTGQRA